MREMSLNVIAVDGITAKVKVKAAAAAKMLAMYVLCPLSMCAAVCSCSGQSDENVTVLTEKQVLDGALEAVSDTVCVLPDTVYVRRAWMMDPDHVMCEMEGRSGYSLRVRGGEWCRSRRLSYLGTSHEGCDLRGQSAGGQSLLFGEHGSWYQSGRTETDFP